MNIWDLETVLYLEVISNVSTIRSVRYKKFHCKIVRSRYLQKNNVVLNLNAIIMHFYTTLLVNLIGELSKCNSLKLNL